MNRRPLKFTRVRYFKEKKIKLNVVKWPFMPILSLLVVAKSMALDLSGFSVILLAQNQACSDSKHDSRAETRVTMLFGDRTT